jgi:hypothetical protein
MKKIHPTKKKWNKDRNKQLIKKKYKLLINLVSITNKQKYENNNEILL